MSGTFARQMYDLPTYQTELRQSTAPLQYLLNPMRNDVAAPGRIVDPGFNGSVGVSITHKRPLIDVESDLKLLDIKNTKDPNQLYHPRCPQCGSETDSPTCGGVVSGCKGCQEQMFNLPKIRFNRDYTRLSNPTCTARELGLNRFQPLNINPQDEARWRHQAEVGINYRMIVKDNHVPCIPKLMDQSRAFPSAQPDIPVFKKSFIAPMHKYSRFITSMQQ